MNEYLAPTLFKSFSEFCGPEYVLSCGKGWLFLFKPSLSMQCCMYPSWPVWAASYPRPRGGHPGLDGRQDPHRPTLICTISWICQSKSLTFRRVIRLSACAGMLVPISTWDISIHPDVQRLWQYRYSSELVGMAAPRGERAFAPLGARIYSTPW